MLLAKVERSEARVSKRFAGGEVLRRARVQWFEQHLGDFPSEPSLPADVLLMCGRSRLDELIRSSSRSTSYAAHQVNISQKEKWSVGE